MLPRLVAQGICAICYAVEVAILLYISQNDEKKKKYYVAAKMMCSVSFLVFSLVFALISEHWKYYGMLLPALGLCALGDLFLGIYNTKKKMIYMIGGIISFLSAHIAFVIVLYKIAPMVTWWNIAVPVVAFLVMLLQKRFTALEYGKLFPPAVIYGVFLAVMFSMCTQYMVCFPSIASAWVGVGGILFFISDYTINFNYFYKFESESWKKIVACINLGTYYFGMLAFAISILYY